MNPIVSLVTMDFPYATETVCFFMAVQVRDLTSPFQWTLTIIFGSNDVMHLTDHSLQYFLIIIIMITIILN